MEYRPTARDSTGPTHNGGFIMFPHCEAGLVPLYEELPNSGRLQAVTTTSESERFPPTNVGSYAALVAQTRTTAMGIRVTYTGTELNRSGKYYAGLLPITEYARGNFASHADPLSVAGLNPVSEFNYDIGAIKNQLIHLTEGRIGSDAFHAVWRPAQSMRYSYAQGNQSVPTTVADANTRSPSIFSTDSGGRGVERGQYALVVLIIGDTTSTASNSGNVYSVQFVQHNEVIPDNSIAVTYEVEPSRYDVNALMHTVNLMATTRVATTLPGTTERTSAQAESAFMSLSSMSASARDAIAHLAGNAFAFAGNRLANGAMGAVVGQLRGMGNRMAIQW